MAAKRRNDWQRLLFFGNVVNDAGLMSSADDKKTYSRVRVAISESEGAIYLDIVLFDDFAEKMVPHLTRGKRIFVEGRLSADEKNRISIIAKEIRFLGTPQRNHTEAA